MHREEQYLTRLTPFSVGYAALVQLFSPGRISFVKPSATPAVRNKVHQLLRNKPDRTFLLVAQNGQARVFCSHDYRDVSVSKRRAVKAQLGVIVDDAAAVTALI